MAGFEVITYGRFWVIAEAQEFPRGNLVVQCPLCGELRRYRPSEVYLGFPDSHLIQQQVSITRRRKGGW
jgi:hypothetical protein